MKTKEFKITMIVMFVIIIGVSGYITFAFLFADEDCLKQHEQDYVLRCYENVYDVDGNGYISIKENLNRIIHVNCMGYYPERAWFECIK